jgi:hypothetical protein
MVMMFQFSSQERLIYIHNIGGESLEDSPNGGSPKAGSLDRNPLGGPPFDPLVGFYEWPTFDSKMFMHHGTH